LLIALLLVLIVVFVRVRRRARETAAEDPGERGLDTVADWPPTATRILTTAERLAYETLVRALPDYLVLAKVPLARFLKVPNRHSYSEWLRRLGHQCADLVVCDSASAVVAAVTVQPPPAETSERARIRYRRLSRVLKAAKIPLHLWTSNALPTVDEARKLLLPQIAEATPDDRPRPRVTPAAAAPARPSPPGIDAREISDDERFERLEPPPSTWFDEFNTGSAAPKPPEPRR
jgi:hypothetical protein